MATFTIEIDNTLVLIGPGDPTLWGTLEWGTNNWGTDNDTNFAVSKVLDAETITLTDSFTKQAGPVLDMGTISGEMTMSQPCHFDGFGEFKYVRAGDYGVDGFNKTADSSDGWSKVSDGSDGWGAV